MYQTIVVLLIILSLVVRAAYADTKDLIEKGADVGFGIVKLAMADGRESEGLDERDAALPPKTKEILEKLQKNYAASEAERLGVEVAGANTQLVITALSTGIMIASGGTAAPWVVLGEKALSKGVDALVASQQATIRDKSMKFVSSHRDALVSSLELDDFSSLPIDQIAERLKRIDSIEKDLEKQFPGDDQSGLRDLARTAAADSIKNLALEGIRRTDANAADIQDIRKEFAGFITQTNELNTKIQATLDGHDKRLAALDGAVRDLNSAMAKVNKQITNNSNDLDILSDFAFSKMSASEKVGALERGLFSVRYECTPEMSTKDCDDRTKRRDILIDAYKAEARTEKAVNELSKISAGLGDIATISHNLGIEVPYLDEAANYAGVAANAAGAFMTHNYLGGVAALSGMFAKQADPDAERHKQMMEYLQKQFKQVNEKLNRIAENQEKILKGLDTLSRQIEQRHKLIQQRLGVIQWDQQRIGQAVFQNLVGEWRPCNNLMIEALRDSDTYGYSAKHLDFKNAQAIFELRRKTTGSAASCIQYAQEQTNTLYSSKFFGNFLDLNLVFNSEESFDADGFQLEDCDHHDDGGCVQNEVYFKRSTMQVYIEKIYKTSHDLISKELAVALQRSSGLNGNWASVYVELTHPATNILDVRYIQKEPCTEDALRNIGNSASLICQPRSTTHSNPPNADLLAKTRLSVPINSQFALQVSDWMLLASRMSDIQDHRTNGISFYQDTEDYLKNVVGGVSVSEGLLENAETVLTYSIASKGMLYGRPLLDAIKRHIETNTASTEREIAIKLLHRNKLLRSNFVMQALHDRLTFGRSTQSGRRTLSANTYRFAIDTIIDDPQHGLEPLYALFGKDRFGQFFQYNSKRSWPEMCFKMGDKHRCSPLPSADDFEAGTIEYPKQLLELVGAREVIRSRLYEYRALDGFNDKEIRSVVETLAE